MKDRPIPFSAPMVRALLAGTKTQTRRVVKPVGDDDGFVLQDYGDGWWPYRSDDGESSMKNGMEIPHSCPYGQPGDRLWVREAWRTYRGNDKTPPRELTTAHHIWFEADEPINLAAGKLRPGMFMPRWASRITLEVTGVRVERLQDISEADAQAEGARECDPVSGREVLLAGPSQRGSFRLHYRDIWEQINGAGSWNLNPWVWVVEFKRLEAA